MWASPPGRVHAHKAAPGSAWGGSRAGFLAEESPPPPGEVWLLLPSVPPGRPAFDMSSPPYQLELDTKYANQTCGLCGDFNGDPVLNEFLSHGEPHVPPSPTLCSSSSHCTPCKAVFQGPKPNVSTRGARMHTHRGLHSCAVPTCRYARTCIVPAHTCTHNPGHLQSQTSFWSDPAAASWPWSPPPSPGPV